MRMNLAKETCNLIQLHEDKFNELMDGDDFDAAYGITLSLCSELRRLATDVENCISAPLRTGMIRRAAEIVQNGRKKTKKA